MVAGQDMFRTALVGGLGRDLSKVHLVIKPKHRIYIVNEGVDNVELAKGFMLAGFGKGKFKFQEKEPTANPVTHIPYELSSPSDLVLLGNKLKTVQEVLEEKRATDPMARLCYYNVLPIPGATAGKFKLEKTHSVLFGMVDVQVVEDPTKSTSTTGSEALSNRLGALIPANCWKSHCMNIVWAVKWVPTGLQPVRPLVCLTCPITLAPGKALDCS